MLCKKPFAHTRYHICPILHTNFAKTLNVFLNVDIFPSRRFPSHSERSYEHKMQSSTFGWACPVSFHFVVGGSLLREECWILFIFGCFASTHISLKMIYMLMPSPDHNKHIIHFSRRWNKRRKILLGKIIYANVDMLSTFLVALHRFVVFLSLYLSRIAPYLLAFRSFHVPKYVLISSDMEKKLLLLLGLLFAFVENIKWIRNCWRYGIVISALRYNSKGSKKWLTATKTFIYTHERRYHTRKKMGIMKKYDMKTKYRRSILCILDI